jgi:hypothetical protein
MSPGTSNGRRSALASADELHQAATLLDTVEWRLDAASQHSGRIAWHSARPEPLPSMARLAARLGTPPAGSGTDRSAQTRSLATLAGHRASAAHRSEPSHPVRGPWVRTCPSDVSGHR